ncbi:MAG: cobalamin-dependent protein [Thermodesulfobacteriota bacterium]|nr:cobalamin-dependent protein [Thermodesulfobacteriota bacterium]
MAPTLILINPWIYDFAAYDLWSKPLGLLYLTGFLRGSGFNVHLIDCLDVHHPPTNAAEKQPTRRAYGTGKFRRQQVSTPLPLGHIKRPYSRYGLPTHLFEQALKTIENPAAILVTSLMTYWYPGVKEVISLSRKIHPSVPVILGGIYARLCYDHALENMGADRIITDDNPSYLLEVLNQYGIARPGPVHGSAHTNYPAFDLLSKIDYVCIATSSGCPNRCRYCASHFLNPHFKQRDPGEVVEEIMFWHRDFGIRDFAFYDDALLIGAEDHLAIALEGIARLNLDLRFHTPNALHIKEITSDIAGLLRRTGFVTIRLGLETSDFSSTRNLDNKVGEGDFERAVGNMLQAGFDKKDMGAYVLMGLPGQSVDSVLQTLDFVEKTGAVPYLSEYSPVPHTSLWTKALSHSEYDLAQEPLFHNNTLLSCWDEAQRSDVARLRQRVLEIRHRSPL